MRAATGTAAASGRPDDTADPILCAADLVAQAEHDEIASPILITDSHSLAERVAVEAENDPVLALHTALDRLRFRRK